MLRAGVDIGGTFTDIILATSDGRVLRAKVPSTVADYSRGIVGGLGRALGEAGLDPAGLGQVVHGTTVATNLILEHKGATTGLITTAGFRDVLEIGRLRRPDLYDIFWDKPEPLVRRFRRLEVDERVLHDGSVQRPLDREQARARIRELLDRGAESLAVCLLHSYANPEHEQMIREIAREERPDLPVSISAEVLPEIQEYERTSTTVVNAYVAPAVERYVERLERGLRELGSAGELLIMHSNGGTVTAHAARERPVHIVESGPAAGVLAAAMLGRELGIDNLLTFDMGGTTAKASLIEGGRIHQTTEYSVGGGISSTGRAIGATGYAIRVPVIDVAEVGAGGGSLARVDAGGSLRVGPESAGAEPGPACYGLGGERATVTDANVVLGYANPVALAGGSLPIDPQRSRDAVQRDVAGPLGLDPLLAAYGIHSVANAMMTRALKAVSTERGRDPRDFAMVAFGGAGPMHAIAVAREIGVQRVIVPPAPGLFSAIGLLLADLGHDEVQTLLGRTDRLDPERVEVTYAALERRARDQLEQEGVAPESVRIERRADLRYHGQSSELAVAAPDGPIDPAALAELAERFAVEHERTYGYRTADEPVELVNLRIRASAPGGSLRFGDLARALLSDEVRSTAPRRAYFGPELGELETPIVSRAEVDPEGMAGPFIVEEPDTTIVVPPGCTARLDELGCLHLDVGVAATATADESAGRGAGAPATVLAVRFDPITFELVRNGLHAVCDEMVTTMVRTSRSQVAKDTMDFSTALCDDQGRLIAQGTTLPFHLGSVQGAVIGMLAKYRGRLEPEDIVVMNDPYSGAMHLPDVFIFKPIFHRGAAVAYAAVVSHQADIGGRVGGGNAADSTEIFQEGLRLPPLKLYERGEPNESIWEIIRANVRLPVEVVGDLQAQVAGCFTAERGFLALADRYGIDRLRAYVEALLDYSERLTRAAVRAAPDGIYRFADHLDDDGMGSDPVRIAATVTIEGDDLTVDFAGTAPQTRGAINSHLSFTQSSTWFAVRASLGVDAPVNAGFFRAVPVLTEPGTVVNPLFPAACAARGVTGSRIADTVFGALARALPERVFAAGDGSVHVLCFSGYDAARRPFVFMEAFCSGWGARPTADGVEGTSHALVNMRNNPIELLEAEYPLVVEEYGFRPDSGGAGTFRGALALVRQVRFLEERGVLQIRTDRARHAPYGLAGGHDGTTSLNILDPNGAAIGLPPKVTRDIHRDEVIRHVHAGGGGWGDPLERDPGLVLEDVRDEKISPELARRSYGVVIDPEGLTLDLAATDRLRDRLRALRGVGPSVEASLSGSRAALPH